MTKVAVIGASGAVGRCMLNELAALADTLEVSAFASPRSAGKKIKYKGKDLTVQAFELNKLAGIPYVLMSAGGDFSKEFALAIAKQGSIVIDNSSAWRMHKDAPLIVPEVNLHALKDFTQGVIANPNCSTIQMVVSLKPLADKFGLKSVHVATYQSVSGSGQKGISELDGQLKAYPSGAESLVKNYARQIAVNLIPAIDVIIEGGHCREEEKMVRETRKIMGFEHLEVLASTVRVPVLYCHSEVINAELARPVSRDEALAALRDAPGVKLYENDDYADFPCPIDIAGRGDVAVARVRLPYGRNSSTWVQYWNVADNLSKGAATNAVQILSHFLRKRGR